ELQVVHIEIELYMRMVYFFDDSEPLPGTQNAHLGRLDRIEWFQTQIDSVVLSDITGLAEPGNDLAVLSFPGDVFLNCSGENDQVWRSEPASDLAVFGDDVEVILQVSGLGQSRGPTDSSASCDTSAGEPGRLLSFQHRLGIFFRDAPEAKSLQAEFCDTMNPLPAGHLPWKESLDICGQSKLGRRHFKGGSGGSISRIQGQSGSGG